MFYDESRAGQRRWCDMASCGNGPRPRGIALGRRRRGPPNDGAADAAFSPRAAVRPRELREIKRLWVRHSIAEDARDIDGLVTTLTPNCAYELIPTGQRWDGHDGARAFYMELFAAFPDNRFELTDIVVGPQGVFEAARLTGTNLGPWAGVSASGLPIALEVLILFPWDPVTRLFLGERIWFDRGEIRSLTLH